MGRTRVKLTGVEELQAHLLDLAKKVDKQVSQEALKDSGAYLMRQAKANAPVDTGELRRGIKGSFKGQSYEVVSTKAYSGYVEYGTRFMSAQPFMKPAFEDAKEHFERKIKRILLS